MTTKTSQIHGAAVPGSRKRRRIDLVWSVFGFDPFGFRLTKVYNGDDFTCVVVNRPLSEGGGVSGPFWRREAEATCVQTNLCSYPMQMTDAIKHDVARQIIGQRQLAHQRAVDLVERRAAELLIDRLKNEAATNRTGNRSLEAAFRIRLDRLFARRVTTDAQLVCFTEIVDRRIANFDTAARSADLTNDGAAACVDWGRWLAAYHAVLNDLRPFFGLPGDVFNNGTLTETVRAQVRDLREIPLHL